MKEVFLSITITFSLLIISCNGDDIVSNNNSNNGTLIFSSDSISVSTSDSGTIMGLGDSYLEYFHNLNNIKIEFDGESNFDSADGYFYTEVSAADSEYTQYSLRKQFDTKEEINIHHEYYAVLGYPVSSVYSTVGIIRKLSYKFCYIRFKNIKIYSVN